LCSRLDFSLPNHNHHTQYMTNNHERKKRKHAQADARKTEEEMETVDRLLSASANAIHSFHIESVKLQRDTEDNIKGLVRFRQQSSLFFTQVSNPDRGGVSSSGAIKSNRLPSTDRTRTLSLATIQSKYTKPADTSTCDPVVHGNRVNWKSISQWHHMNLNVLSTLVWAHMLPELSEIRYFEIQYLNGWMTFYAG